MAPTKAKCSKKITHKTYWKPSAPGAAMTRQKLLDPMSLKLWVATKIQSIVPGTHGSQITTAVMVRRAKLVCIHETEFTQPQTVRLGLKNDLNFPSAFSKLDRSRNGGYLTPFTELPSPTPGPPHHHHKGESIPQTTFIFKHKRELIHMLQLVTVFSHLIKEVGLHRVKKNPQTS